MNFKPMMRILCTGQIVQRPHIEPAWCDKGGINSIWGNADLKRMLLPKTLTLHASKQNNHRVDLRMRQAINRSVRRKDTDGNELFCFYVGKTAHLKKRMQIQRHPKMWNLLGLENSNALRAMLHLSFCPISNWEERFFAEGYAIAMLLPVVNAQPER